MMKDQTRTHIDSTAPHGAPETQISEIATRLIQGSAPFGVALAAYREYHGLRLTDVSKLCGYQPSAVSTMLNDPKRTPRVRKAVEELIGYAERAG